jgi:hypothetical protein
MTRKLFVCDWCIMNIEVRCVNGTEVVVYPFRLASRTAIMLALSQDPMVVVNESNKK